jgi:transposase
MGRSRGGLNTKIHALVDALGQLVVPKLIEGRAADGRSAEGRLESRLLKTLKALIRLRFSLI